MISVHANFIDSIYAYLGGLVVWYLKRWPGFDSQPGLVLSTVNSFQLMINFFCFISSKILEGCAPYIFASLFCMPKREHLWNKENYFLFHFKSYFCPWYNQILTFKVFKCYDVIKCLSMKQESTFYWITWKVNTVWY